MKVVKYRLEVLGDGNVWLDNGPYLFHDKQEALTTLLFYRRTCPGLEFRLVYITEQVVDWGM